MRISDWSSDVCSSDLGLRHTTDLRRDRRHGGPQRWVLTAMLLHHPNGTLAHLGGKRVCLVHSSILSRVGASSNPGAVHIGQRHYHSRLFETVICTEGKMALCASDREQVELSPGQQASVPSHHPHHVQKLGKIGSASCRERVGQYGESLV